MKSELVWLNDGGAEQRRGTVHEIDDVTSGSQRSLWVHTCVKCHAKDLGVEEAEARRLMSRKRNAKTEQRCLEWKVANRAIRQWRFLGKHLEEPEWLSKKQCRTKTRELVELHLSVDNVTKLFTPYLHLMAAKLQGRKTARKSAEKLAEWHNHIPRVDDKADEEEGAHTARVRARVCGCVVGLMSVCVGVWFPQTSGLLPRPRERVVSFRTPVVASSTKSVGMVWVGSQREGLCVCVFCVSAASDDALLEIKKGTRLEDEFQQAYNVQRAFGDKSEQQSRFIRASTYYDEWFNENGDAFRTYYLCLPCKTASLAGNDLRFFCNVCCSRYKARHGVLIEMKHQNCEFYSLAEIPDCGIVELKSMIIQQQSQDTKTVEELMEQMVQPVTFEKGALITEVQEHKQMTTFSEDPLQKQTNTGTDRR